MFDVRLTAGSRVELSLPEGQNTGVVLLHGDVVVNSLVPVQGEAKIAVLSAAGEVVSLEAKAESVLLILGGEPIREPVASYGPFVMNTQAELQEAFRDYKSGKMGRL